MAPEGGPPEVVGLEKVNVIEFDVELPDGRSLTPEQLLEVTEKFKAWVAEVELLVGSGVFVTASDADMLSDEEEEAQSEEPLPT